MLLQVTQSRGSNVRVCVKTEAKALGFVILRVNLQSEHAERSSHLERVPQFLIWHVIRNVAEEDAGLLVTSHSIERMIGRVTIKGWLVVLLMLLLILHHRWSDVWLATKVSHTLWLHVWVRMRDTPTHSRVYRTMVRCARILRMRESLWTAKLIRHWSLWRMLHLIPSHSWLLRICELLWHVVVLSTCWSRWLIWHLLILHELLLVELHVLLLGLWLLV